jgi:hypothetical protein
VEFAYYYICYYVLDIVFFSLYKFNTAHLQDSHFALSVTMHTWCCSQMGCSENRVLVTPTLAALSAATLPLKLTVIVIQLSTCNNINLFVKYLSWCAYWRNEYFFFFNSLWEEKYVLGTQISWPNLLDRGKARE